MNGMILSEPALRLDDARNQIEITKEGSLRFQFRAEMFLAQRQGNANRHRELLLAELKRRKQS